MSGWSTLTIICNDADDAEEMRDALIPVVERDDDVWVRNSDETEVRALDWGYGGTNMKVLKDNADLWTEAMVMNCNDTSDSGSGKYYTSDGDSVTEEARASGYEGAHGRDAAGELRGEAGFRPYMR